jgi:hypothetical protein
MCRELERKIKKWIKMLNEGEIRMEHIPFEYHELISKYAKENNNV